MPPDPASANHVILCLNSGSSSLKFALYHLGGVEEVRLAHGAVERIGLSGGHLWIRGMDNDALVDVHRDFPDHTAAAEGISAAAISTLGSSSTSCAPNPMVRTSLTTW